MCLQREQGTTIVESLGGIGKEDLMVDDGEVHREHLQTVEQHE